MAEIQKRAQQLKKQQEAQTALKAKIKVSYQHPWWILLHCFLVYVKVNWALLRPTETKTQVYFRFKLGRFCH